MDLAVHTTTGDTTCDVTFMETIKGMSGRRRSNLFFFYFSLNDESFRFPFGVANGQTDLVRICQTRGGARQGSAPSHAYADTIVTSINTTFLFERKTKDGILSAVVQ